jgi:hypothetical protein
MGPLRTLIALTAGSMVVAACHHRAPESESSPTYTPDAAARSDTTMSTSQSMSSRNETAMRSSSDTSASGMRDGSARSSRSSGMNRGSSRGAGEERRELALATRTLTRARYALEHASHEFGGHRTDALRAVDGALAEVRLASGQEARPQTPRTEPLEAKEIRRAVSDLERARRDMETAKHNFGGRRTETLKAVDKALSELRLAAENEK